MPYAQMAEMLVKALKEEGFGIKNLVFDDMGEFVLSEPKAQLLRSRGWLGLLAVFIAGMVGVPS